MNGQARPAEAPTLSDRAGDSTPGAPGAVEVPVEGPGPPETRRTLVRKTAAAVVLDVDQAMAEILGWRASDMVGRTSLDFIHPDDQTLAIENWMLMLGAPGPGRPLQFRHKHRDGSWVWLEMVNHNLLDDPDESCVVAEMADIDGAMAARGAALEAERLARSEPDGEDRPLKLHEALRAREQLLHRLAEALPVGVLHVDAQGRVLYTNDRLHAMVGKLRCASFGEQLSTVLDDDRPRVVAAFEAALTLGVDDDVEVRLAVPADGGGTDVRQCSLSIRTLASDAGDVTGAVACVADVTDSVRMRDQLQLQATFDRLTRCYNRASTMDALEKMLAGAGSDGRPAVIFVDLDNFKGINDHLGHAAGDQVLEVVARRLRGAVREDDVVGRIGGDEFLVLCPGVRTAAQAVRAAARVTESLRHTMKLQEVEVSCRASVGVSWSPEAGLEADTLIGQADAAMYEAKRAGSGRPLLYKPAR